MPDLRVGDIFCTSNPMWLGRAIRFIERTNDIDGEATYSHAGVIMDYRGKTFEALWTNKKQDLFQAYAGKQILIGRHERMNASAAEKGWDNVKDLEGNWYAGHRLFLHLIPPLAKWLAMGKWAVCSELTAKYLVGAGLLNFWPGVNPDYLADMIRRWKEWHIVYEGPLPATIMEYMSMPYTSPCCEPRLPDGAIPAK